MAAGCGMTAPCCAAETAPAVRPGASRDVVMETYGWPTGQSWSGSREILNYPQGLVTLESGRVERVDFTNKFVWPAPRPRPPAPSPVSAKAAAARPDPWLGDFEAAARTAAATGRPILALFAQHDGSPASRQFHEQVAVHADLLNGLAADVVFFRPDFSPAMAPGNQRPRLNEELRAKLGVTVFPTMLLLSPRGEVLARLDLTASLVGGTFRARLVRAVKAECARLTTATAMVATEAVAKLPPEVVWAQRTLARSLGLSLADALMVGVAMLALAVLAILGWLLWRTRMPKDLPAAALAVPLSNAEDGVPTSAEIAGWSKEKICVVAAALAESEGLVAEFMPSGSDKDLVLKNHGEAQPRVVVLCAAANTGVVTTKRLRELRGTLTAEGASVGWFVAPKGFASDAVNYAAEHSLQLIDASRIVERLRKLPPLLLPKALPPVLPHGALRQAA